MACSPVIAGCDGPVVLNSVFPRAFVAVDIEPVDRHALQGLQHQLGRSATSGWLGVDDLHITLRFLGDIEETCAADVAGRCAALAAVTPASTARPEALETWPPEQLRVLVLTLAVEPALAALQRATMSWPSTTMPDSRPWRPHITLRRARSADVPPFPAAPTLPESLRCQRLALFARAGTDTLARYRRIATWPLLGIASAPR